MMVLAGELQVTLQLPFWGDVSLSFRCKAPCLSAHASNTPDGGPNSKQAAPEGGSRLDDG
jgi:hypothetical protein